MIIQNATPTRYTQLKSRLLEEYTISQTRYNLNFTTKEETLQDVTVYWITNSNLTTKLIYDKTQAVIVESKIFTSDIRIITELKESL